MGNKRELKALILAAGEGTRLRPYTLDRPKCLVEVANKSLLDRQLAVLRAENVSSIVLIGGYLSHMLERPELKMSLNPNYAVTNMVSTLFCAEAEMQGDIVICYGDIVYSQRILKALLESDADIATTIDLNWESYWRSRNEEPLDDAETLKLNADGSINEIGRKPQSLDEIEGQYMGLIKLSARGVEIIKSVFHQAKASGLLLDKPIEKAYMTDLLQAIIGQGFTVQSVPITDSWVEVDTVSDLLSEVTKKRLDQIEEELN